MKYEDLEKLALQVIEINNKIKVKEVEINLDIAQGISPKDIIVKKREVLDIMKILLAGIAGSPEVVVRGDWEVKGGCYGSTT